MMQMTKHRSYLHFFSFQVQSRIDKCFGQPKRPANAEKVLEAKAELARAVNHIDEYFLKDKPFIAGDDISIADLVALTELSQLRGVHETAIYESNPKVKAWAKRVEEKTKPHFQEAHAILDDIAKQFKAGK